MAAGHDHQALTNPVSKDMQLPPTPPEDYSNEHNIGLETPPMETLQQQLLTPDNTPPGMVLHPPRPLLGREASSRANSFRTAREEQSREFLAAAAAAAGSQVVEEDALSDEVSARSDDDDEDDDDTVDEEPWRHIPGAFRSTPSTTSSRNVSQPSRRIGSFSTPSTSSSDKAVRPKQYLDVESPPSTGSSRNIVRERQYRHDTESPLDRQRVPAGDHADGSVSYAHSERSSEGDAKESETSQHESVEGRKEGSAEEESDHEGDDGEDWQNHVSYMAMDGANDSVREYEGAATPARTGSPSSRLSGQGRRIGSNSAQHSDQFKGINNPPYSPSGISSKAAEQGLLKRGSDDSSRQRSDETPSPSVGAQQRRQKVAYAESSPATAAASPRAREREARRMNWLRQHAGTLASPDIPVEFLTAPPRNSNDLVYKHIQQANMDRFDALKNGQAVEAVVIPTDEARSRQLRHVTKRQSLRSMSDSSAYMPSSAPRRDHNLRHKKALTPQKVPPQGSPVGTPNTRSVSGSHSLRHEKRPLSGTGRPLQSNDNSPALSHANGHSALQQVLKAAKETPKLRHSSLPIHLNADLSKASPATSDSKKGERRRNHALRRSSREYRLENNAPTADHVPEHNLEHAPPQKDPSTIVETTTYTSPHLLGFDAHHRNRNLGTPFSVSAVSDRTDMEVCEAQNVAYYPHSNESLLVVQHHSKSEQKGQGDENTPAKSNHTIASDGGARLAHLFPELPAQSPPAIAVNGKSIHTVESPLTNPREAPIPPVIKFIPATPSHEDDERELVPVIEEGITGPQRRGSLANRARRYSEVVVRPLFGRTLVTRSHHIHPSPTAAEKRDERLHPNWVPNSFWHDDDDDDDEDYSDSEEPFERLPAGGDTSEHPRSKFPRNMSVRMPGFRGSGGFLLGNSLGMDRHGTNKRRPYVTPPGGTDSTPTPKKTVRRVSSMDSVTSRTSAEGRIFSIPGTHQRIQYVGFQPLKDKIKKRRQTKEDAVREKRRAELKDQIGMRIVHDA
jgi:hypothetical protein